MKKALSRNIDIVYRHYNLPANFPISALIGNEWICKAEPITKMHFHNCVEIGLLKDGHGSVYVGDKVYTLQAPAITIIPANTVHFSNASEGSLCHWSWFYVDVVRLLSNLPIKVNDEIKVYLNKNKDQCCIFDENNGSNALQILKLIENEMLYRQTHYRTAVRGLMSALFLCLMRENEQPINVFENEKPINNVALAAEYMSTHFADDLHMETLSQLCHISLSHFRREFKRVYGKSPQSFLENIRIEQACSLMYNSNLSITEIGIHVGFSSPSSFVRQFNKIHGIPPSKWLNKMRNEENPAVTNYLFKVTEQNDVESE